MATPAQTTMRALDREGLLDAARLPGCYVELLSWRDHLHSRYSCPLGAGLRAGSTVVRLTLPELVELPADRFCALCHAQAQRMLSRSPLLADVCALLDAARVARAALRHNARTAAHVQPGKTVKLRSSLARKRGQVERLTGDGSATFTAAQGAVLDLIDQATQSLPGTVRDDGQRQRVAQWVADELIPTAMRGRVHLDDSRVLVGIAPHRIAGSQRVQEVLDTFGVPATAGVALLDCPRFVADFLNRCYQQGVGWQAVVLTVPLDGISDEQIRATGQMWAPLSDGPMADLRAALVVAADVLTEAA